MKKAIRKVGFKFSWETETEETEIQSGVSIINTLETDKTAFTELENRINSLKNVLVSSGYAKMKKEQRINILNTYEFYTALHTEYSLKN